MLPPRRTISRDLRRKRVDGGRRQVLRLRMGTAAGKVSTRVLPNWLMRFTALRNPALKGVLPLLDYNMNATSEKARRLLGWAPRSREDAIVATAESLVQLGLLGGSKEAA